MRRNIFEEVHDDFRATARTFFERECVPNTEKWEKDGKVSASTFDFPVPLLPLQTTRRPVRENRSNESKCDPSPD